VSRAAPLGVGLIKKTVSYTFIRPRRLTVHAARCSACSSSVRPTFASSSSSLIHSFIPAFVRFASAAAFCNLIKTPAARAFALLQPAAANLVGLGAISFLAAHAPISKPRQGLYKRIRMKLEFGEKEKSEM
jgi:hypothetical protein